MISNDLQSQIIEENVGSPNSGPIGLNQAQNEVKPTQKILGTQIWAKRVKIGPKISLFFLLLFLLLFFCFIFSILVY